MVSSGVFAGLLVTLAAVVASYQAQSQDAHGLVEAGAARAQEALHTLWQRARDEAGGVVDGILHGFHRQEHDALHAASVQLEQLGVAVDLNEAGDQVEEDLYGCAQGTKVRYTRLLEQLKRRVQRCWGWESREVTALVRSIEDLILAGDRLPNLLRTNMQLCLARGRRVSPRKARASKAPSADEDAAEDRTTLPIDRVSSSEPPPSPFRLLKCTADSVNLTWTYVTSVPREVGRAARKTAALLGSSREDWAACGRSVVRQTAGAAMQTLRDLGVCVADRVSEQSWAQLHAAWQNPKRKR